MNIKQYGISNVSRLTKVYFCGSSEPLTIDIIDEEDDTATLKSKNGSIILASLDDCTVNDDRPATRSDIDNLIKAMRVKPYNRRYKSKRIHK